MISWVVTRVNNKVFPLLLLQQVTWAQMWTSNLIPVTLGNTVAGMLCMALPYALLFGSLGNKITALTQKRTALA